MFSDPFRPSAHHPPLVVAVVVLVVVVAAAVLAVVVVVVVVVVFILVVVVRVVAVAVVAVVMDGSGSGSFCSGSSIRSCSGGGRGSGTDHGGSCGCTSNCEGNHLGNVGVCILFPSQLFTISLPRMYQVCTQHIVLRRGCLVLLIRCPQISFQILEVSTQKIFQSKRKNNRMMGLVVVVVGRR